MIEITRAFKEKQNELLSSYPGLTVEEQIRLESMGVSEFYQLRNNALLLLTACEKSPLLGGDCAEYLRQLVVKIDDYKIPILTRNFPENACDEEKIFMLNIRKEIMDKLVEEWGHAIL